MRWFWYTTAERTESGLGSCKTPKADLQMAMESAIQTWDAANGQHNTLPFLKNKTGRYCKTINTPDRSKGNTKRRNRRHEEKHQTMNPTSDPQSRRIVCRHRRKRSVEGSIYTTAREVDDGTVAPRQELVEKPRQAEHLAGGGHSGVSRVVSNRYRGGTHVLDSCS
jgi:hypothetical protein